MSSPVNNQEILRVTTLLGNASFLDQSGLEHASSLALGGIFSNGGANVNRWASPFQSKIYRNKFKLLYDLCSNASICFWCSIHIYVEVHLFTSVVILISMFSSSKMSSLLQPSFAQNRLGSQGSSSGLIVKRTMRVDITVDQYPNFNFVGRLLGPRGNSLKRVEASAECRVLIKGHGNIKDPVKIDFL